MALFKKLREKYFGLFCMYDMINEDKLLVYIMSMIRTFIAIDIDDDNVREKLARVRDYLLGSKADLKPVTTENIHLTIRFIGEIPLSKVNELCRILQNNLVFKPFKMKIEGLGVFPNIHRPRVIWAGVTEGASELTILHSNIEKLIRPLGIPPNREKFTPHITIARVKSSRNIHKLIKYLEQYINEFFGEILVDKVKVKRSILTPKGPIYSDLCIVKAVE